MNESDKHLGSKVAFETRQIADEVEAERRRVLINNNRKKLEFSDCLTLATNLGFILEQVKEATRLDNGNSKKARRPILREIAREAKIGAGEKAENHLAFFRIRPGGDRSSRATLRKHPQPYLRIALVAARHIPGMTETAVIMLLTRDVSIFQQKGSSAAVRVAKLLRARLKEIESVYDLESYFRKLYALRAIRFVHRTPDNDDTWKSDVISGWGNFDDCHTEMWPRVLLTSIVRSKADARLTIDGAEEDGIVAWTEHLSLTLGFQNDRVEIFLRFDSHFGIWPTGSAWFQPCYRDAPWFWWGLPPPMNDGEVITMFGPPMAQNGSNTSRTISFKIKHGFTKRTGDHWDKEANERRQAKLRLEHFDSETITEWLSGREFMLIESQHLPRLVDPEAILCPPEMAHEPIALLEGVLLGRKAIYEKTSDPHFGNYESVPTFIDELDRVAKLLTTSFDDWRKISEGLAVADHNRLLTESLQRAANLVQSVDYEVLTTEPALENGRVTYALTKQEERIANNGDEA